MKKRIFRFSQGRIAALAGLLISASIVVLTLFLADGPAGGRKAAAQQPVPIQFAPGGRAFVQAGGPRNRSVFQDGEEPADVFLPVDRDTTLQWEQARTLLDGAHYSEAVTLLDGILERGEDFFLKPDDSAPASDRNKHLSLKTEAQRLIGTMPEAGREAYELQFGAKAAQMLAASSGDVTKLEEISRNYFHTKAGYQATLLLGRHHLDHNRPLAAVLCFQRLLEAPAAVASLEPSLSVLTASSWLRAGNKGYATNTLTKLKEKYPDATIRVANKSVQLFNGDTDALAWLQSDVGPQSKIAGVEKTSDWAVVRGNAARNSISTGGMPLLTPRWQVSTTNNPALEQALVGVRQQLVEQGNVTKIPSMQPLAVGNLVLMRATRELWAIDFTTGKRLWPILSGEEVPLEQLLSSYPSDNLRFDALNNYPLRERFWEDATFGTIACDGQQVYLLDGLDMASTSDLNGGMIFNPRAGRLRGPFVVDPQAQIKQVNKLSAHELKSQGKLKWTVGGQTGEDEPQLAGAFFLGPPLPLEGKLYVLAEMKTGEIKLCALDSQTGKLDWSQQVANVEFNILQDRQRRLAGCSPSYADGILVCPTAARAIVGIDLANRTLAWGFQYDRDGNYVSTFGRGGLTISANNLQATMTDHWADANPVIADGSVLVTPVESNRLFCLNLADGSKRWEQQRSDGMYVAGVRQGNVLLVGKHQFTAYNLTDGKVAWKKNGPVAYLESTKPGSQSGADAGTAPVPSGRGYLSGDDYFLPLSSGEVVRIDLNAGKIVDRAKSRSGSVPGNLICYQGEVISQGVDNVETFFQVDALRDRVAKQLAEHPDDAWALGHRGELALTEGRLDDAIVDLRRAYQADDNSYNRDLYIEVMRAALTKDFNKHRSDLHDWEQLVKLDSERAVVLRVKAAGLQKAGDTAEALDALIKLSALEPAVDELDRDEEIDPKLLVVRWRWIKARFNEILAAAKPADRTKIDATLQKQLDQDANASESTTALRQFVHCFGDHPLADQARELLVDRLTGDQTLLEREQLLRHLQQSTNAARKAAATAKFAALLREVDQPEAALAEYKRLETLVGDQPILQGKSVKQMLTALPAESPLRVADAPAPAWRTGEVKIEKSNNERRSLASLHLSSVDVDVRGKPGPFFQNVELLYDYQKQELFGRDSAGKKDRFLVSLADPDRTIASFNPQMNDRYAVAQGHLLAFYNGYQILGLDTLKAPGAPGSRIVWQRDLCDPNSMNGGLMQQNTSWGFDRRTQIVGGMGQPISGLGPCTENTLCFIRGRDVTAVDPLSGALLWVRHGVEPGSEVFGDDEVTVIAPPEPVGSTKPTLILRTTDGKLLSGEQTLPSSGLPNSRWMTYGRSMLGFRATGGGTSAVLALYDPVARHDVWTQNFSGFNGGNGGVKGTIVDNETAALMEPDGKFVMLRIADGRKLMEEKLHEELGLQHIYVLRGAQQDILVTNHLVAGAQAGFIIRGGGRFPIQNGAVPNSPVDSAVMVTGRVYAFDRATGKPQWSGPASIEQQHGLVLSQPADLPVLVFVRSFNSMAPNRNFLQRGSVLCLDKRTGAAVCEDDNWPENTQSNNAFQIVGNPENQTVTLQWPPASLTLTLTDKPAAKATPYQPGPVIKPKDSTDNDQSGISPTATAPASPTEKATPEKPAGEKSNGGKPAAPKSPTDKTEKDGAEKSSPEKPANSEKPQTDKPPADKPSTESTPQEKKE